MLSHPGDNVGNFLIRHRMSGHIVPPIRKAHFGTSYDDGSAESLIAYQSEEGTIHDGAGLRTTLAVSSVAGCATYVKEYHELTAKDGIAFVPYAIWKDMLFSAFVLLLILACAIYFGPFGPSGRPDPTIIQTVPRPDYFFLWLYALLSLLPPSMETPALLIGPVIVIAGLLLLPFIAGEGEKSWRRRPVAVLSIALVAVILGEFTHLAGYTPWSPQMNAWSAEPVPNQFLHKATALERRGALVFQAKQCHNCHALDGKGGMRGPALDAVAVRLTEDQLIRQVIQGGGNMPAYGKNLSPAETTALVAFLKTLHPMTQLPARDASQAAVLGSESGTTAVNK